MRVISSFRGLLHILALALALASLVAGCEGIGAPVDMAAQDADCRRHPETCPFDCDCPASHPICLPLEHRCVPCLPANDICPSGQVCRLVNATYACLTTCSADGDCLKLGGGPSCCDGVCVTLATDAGNCGACGQKCAPVNQGDPGCYLGQCIIASCIAGFDDCNKVQDDGCETPVGSDPLNCGACGMPCQPFKNGVPSCSNGLCSISCAPGFADCNNQIADGCEVDTSFDVNHCGACGKACTAPPGAVVACDYPGRCSFRCKPGFADCDGVPGNGCEVAVAGDLNNCGHCGNVCPVRPHAVSPACNGGLCGSSCSAGFGDCDGNPGNGCESSLMSDLGNCGGCGMLCLNKNAVATCNQGACSLTCNKGFFDCDMDSRTGCESNAQLDPKSCGGCGMACPLNAPYCARGACQAKQPFELVGTLNGVDFFKVPVMGAMTDTNVLAACVAAGMRAPCQAGSPGQQVCTYNDNACAASPESSCGSPMLMLARTICGNQTPSSCQALWGVYQYMGHNWNGDSSCGAEQNAWCIAGNGQQNKATLCIQ